MCNFSSDVVDYVYTVNPLDETLKNIKNYNALSFEIKLSELNNKFLNAVKEWMKHVRCTAVQDPEYGIDISFYQSKFVGNNATPIPTGIGENKIWVTILNRFILSNDGYKQVILIADHSLHDPTNIPVMIIEQVYQDNYIVHLLNYQKNSVTHFQESNVAYGRILGAGYMPMLHQWDSEDYEKIVNKILTNSISVEQYCSMTR